MRGKKKLLARIAKSTNIEWLDGSVDDFHDLADLAAFGNVSRDFNDCIEIEDACRKRIAELKEAAK